MKLSLSELIDITGCSCETDGQQMDITGVAAIKEAMPGEVTFLANVKYAKLVPETKASVIIVPESWEGECSAVLLKAENPDEAFARVAAAFAPPAPPRCKGIHPSAVIGEDVVLGENVSVGPLCVIENGAEIGDNTVLAGQVYVGYKARIGCDCLLYSHVSVREYVEIGNRVIIHDGAVLGSDGFGYSVNPDGSRTKIPQTGTVIVGDDVEIGANTTIDRARFGKTRLSNGVKLDNMVQIAHNVQVGEHTVIAAQSAIAGSTIIGKYVVFGGQVAVNGHISRCRMVSWLADRPVFSIRPSPVKFSMAHQPRH